MPVSKQTDVNKQTKITRQSLIIYIYNQNPDVNKKKKYMAQKNYLISQYKNFKL